MKPMRRTAPNYTDFDIVLSCLLLGEIWIWLGGMVARWYNSCMSERSKETQLAGTLAAALNPLLRNIQNDSTALVLDG
jgi:hypothetical protein